MGKFVKDLVPGALFTVALLFLGYVAGSLTTLSDVFPAQYMRSAYQAADALMLKQAYLRDRYTSNLWEPARTEHRGVVAHRPELTQAGLTVYSSGHGAVALMVDMEGRVIHEWRKPFREVWDETSPVRNPVPDRQVYFRKAEALPNGDLLAVYDGVGDTPWGYGMVKIDRNSQLIWKNLANLHHDFDVAADGRIYTLSHAFRNRRLGDLEHLRPPLLEDHLVILSADGTIERQFSLLEAVFDSPYRRDLYRIFHFSLWDPLHANSVDVLDESAAAALRTKVPQAAAGQVMVGFRELDGGTIALVDVERERVVWALTGAWKSQHDPDILPNGNLLIFDNLGDYSPGGESRVIEVDPSHGGVVWSYTGTPDNRLRSFWRAAQEPQPNGNVLITESQGARLVEVNRHGEVVWEYVNPARARNKPGRVAVVSWASRVDPDSLEGPFRARVLDADPAT